MLTSQVVSVLLMGSLSLVMAGYPSHYEVGYGFVNHGGVGPHGHYLPAVAKVQVHKDPFQSSYSLDEEGPTHYKYIRQSQIHPHPQPIIEPIHHHHHPHDHGHGHHHHHAHHHAHPVAVGIAAPVAVPVHGGVIAEVPAPNLAPPGLAYGVGLGDFGGYYDHGYGGYEGYPYY